jgi:hypothetical protein
MTIEERLAEAQRKLAEIEASAAGNVVWGEHQRLKAALVAEKLEAANMVEALAERLKAVESEMYEARMSEQSMLTTLRGREARIAELEISESSMLLMLREREAQIKALEARVHEMRERAVAAEARAKSGA